MLKKKERLVTEIVMKNYVLSKDYFPEPFGKSSFMSARAIHYMIEVCFP